jgi:hypothetical protein
MEDQRARSGESSSNENRETPAAEARKPWESPRLAFVKPKLAKHGKLDKVTRMPNGFFGQFSP